MPRSHEERRCAPRLVRGVGPLVWFVKGFAKGWRYDLLGLPPENRTAHESTPIAHMTWTVIAIVMHTATGLPLTVTESYRHSAIEDCVRSAIVGHGYSGWVPFTSRMLVTLPDGAMMASNTNTPACVLPRRSDKSAV